MGAIAALSAGGAASGSDATGPAFFATSSAGALRKAGAGSPSGCACGTGSPCHISVMKQASTTVASAALQAIDGRGNSLSSQCSSLPEKPEAAALDARSAAEGAATARCAADRIAARVASAGRSSASGAWSSMRRR